MAKRQRFETPEMVKVREMRERDQASMKRGLAKIAFPDYRDNVMANPKTANQEQEFREALLFMQEQRQREERERYERERYEREMYELRNRQLSSNWFAAPAVPPTMPSWVANVWGEPIVKTPAVDAAKLESLKKAEPYKVAERMPDLMEVITAWRAWRVVNNGGYRLKALGTEHIWEPKAQVNAKCDSRSAAHPAPAMECQCGVWAFKELDGLVAAIGTSYGEIKVLGQVSLWGRVVETENGYRAEKAYPAELWLFDSSLEELGLIYDVPVRCIQ